MSALSSFQKVLFCVAVALGLWFLVGPGGSGAAWTVGFLVGKSLLPPLVFAWVAQRFTKRKIVPTILAIYAIVFVGLAVLLVASGTLAGR